MVEVFDFNLTRIVSARYADRENQRFITTQQDGKQDAHFTSGAPAVIEFLLNGHAGSTPVGIDPWQAGLADVRRETSRRLQLAMEAQDKEHLDLLITDYLREYVRLLKIGVLNWTPAQLLRAIELEAIDATLEAITLAGKTIEALVPIPVDYDADFRWPPL